MNIKTNSVGESVERGFATQEYTARVSAVQQKMAAENLGALLLTTPADVYYFSGFLTQFWQSPTRPWFLIIPASGKPIAIIPDIGTIGMAQTWVSDIRCWSSPRPQDEGISLLVDALAGVGNIGMPLAAESVVRMPVADWLKLQTALLPAKIVDCAAMLQQQRLIKSSAEIAKIARAAQTSAAAHDALTTVAHLGMSERELCRQLRLLMAKHGADDVPYLAAASGVGGVETIIMPPGDIVPADGDILMIDTGVVFDGYFCDFNRNYAMGHVDDNAQRAADILRRAIEAGVDAACPGNTAADIWQAMTALIPAAGKVGRMGHGIGLQLTEQPSITPDDKTPLQEGMVLAIEPSMITVDGRMMVCEENIAITRDKAVWLGNRATAALPQIS
ncbi:MAG: M24 family metallopeptidase [Gammaproteobacteria bacterium WSBS_2016_MAG_OTU1]